MIKYKQTQYQASDINTGLDYLIYRKLYMT